MIFIQSRGRMIGYITGLILMYNFRMGFAGLLVGYWLGSQIEEAFEKSQFQNWHHHKQQTNWPKQMVHPLFSIMGYIAKLDGVVSKQSILYAENVMKRMKLNTQMSKTAISAFNQGKYADFNLKHNLNQMRLHLMFNPTEQQRLIQNFIQMAHIDGNLTPRKKAVLQTILSSLGRGFQYQQGWNQQQNWHQQHQQQHNYHNLNTPNLLAEAHKTLNTKPHEPLSDITKKYRKLISKYHPDRIQSLKNRPPSESEIKQANERTHRIKQAYEVIKQSKNA